MKNVRTARYVFRGQSDIKPQIRGIFEREGCFEMQNWEHFFNLLSMAKQMVFFMIPCDV